jgi:hypothetical protein
VTCLDLTYVFVHIFLIASLLFLTLGAALLGTRLLLAAFNYTALGLGALFQILGFLALFSASAMLATIIVLNLQEVWSVVVAVLLLARRENVPTLVTSPSNA